jgi:predicted transposase YbfD/YdcC
VEQAFKDADPDNIRIDNNYSRDNSRDEYRHLSVLSVDSNDVRFARFPDIKQIIAIVRERIDHRTEKDSLETVYAITSRSAKFASAKQLANYIRMHWSIENNEHRRRDVTYGEDDNRTHTGHSWHCLAVLRNFAISAVNLVAGNKRHARVKRQLAADTNELLRVIGVHPVITRKKL